jgi:hypothetical protein
VIAAVMTGLMMTSVQELTLLVMTEHSGKKAMSIPMLASAEPLVIRLIAMMARMVAGQQLSAAVMI